jgi:RNA polymerase sigma-70 factor (ECF subfamily)
MIALVWRILRDPEDADDAMQDALTAVLKRIEKIRRHPNPQALVLRICSNAAYDVLRKKIRKREREDPDAVPETISDKSPTPWEELADEERRREVFEAVGQLSRNQAEAFLLRFVEELPYSEIAVTLGCSQATVRTHIARGRARLSTLLSHLDPDSGKGESK